MTGNAYQSALQAGYSRATARKGMGHLLNRPDVAAYVEQRQRELAETLIDTRRLLVELQAIAFFDLGEVVQVENGGLVVRDLARLDSLGRAPIAGIKQGVKGLEVRCYDKLKAMEMLMRIGGMLGGQTGADGTHEGEEGFRVEIEVVDEPGQAADDAADGAAAEA